MYYEFMELTVHDETILVYVEQYGENLFTTNLTRGTCEYFTSPMEDTVGSLLTLLMRADRIVWIDEDFESVEDLQADVLEICDRGMETDHIKDLFARY